MIPDYDDWYYWFAFYTDSKKTVFTTARVSVEMNMVEMMKHFMSHQPPMKFTPTHMYLGRVLDSKQGRKWYDNGDYEIVFPAILNNDKSLVADVCITQLIKAKSQAEFDAYKKVFPHGRTFDQLDSLIKSKKNN